MGQVTCLRRPLDANSCMAFLLVPTYVTEISGFSQRKLHFQKSAFSGVRGGAILSVKISHQLKYTPRNFFFSCNTFH